MEICLPSEVVVSQRPVDFFVIVGFVNEEERGGRELFIYATNPCPNLPLLCPKGRASPEPRPHLQLAVSVDS